MACYPCIRCNKCGAFSARAAIVCVECGTEVPIGKAACPNCGCKKVKPMKLPDLPKTPRYTEEQLAAFAAAKAEKEANKAAE